VKQAVVMAYKAQDANALLLGVSSYASHKLVTDK